MTLSWQNRELVAIKTNCRYASKSSQTDTGFEISCLAVVVMSTPQYADIKTNLRPRHVAFQYTYHRNGPRGNKSFLSRFQISVLHNAYLFKHATRSILEPGRVRKVQTAFRRYPKSPKDASWFSSPDMVGASR